MFVICKQYIIRMNVITVLYRQNSVEKEMVGVDKALMIIEAGKF